MMSACTTHSVQLQNALQGFLGLALKSGMRVAGRAAMVGFVAAKSSMRLAGRAAMVGFVAAKFSMRLAGRAAMVGFVAFKFGMCLQGALPWWALWRP